MARLTEKHRDGTKQHHEAAPSSRPVLNEKAEDTVAMQQRAQKEKSNRQNYFEDKRKEARIEHTNGSTPRRDL